MIYKNGCTLLDQVYKEGETTWGCKSGVLDVGDVESFILQIGMLLDVYDIVPGIRGKIKERMDELCGSQSDY